MKNLRYHLVVNASALASYSASRLAEGEIFAAIRYALVAIRYSLGAFALLPIVAHEAALTESEPADCEECQKCTTTTNLSN